MLLGGTASRARRRYPSGQGASHHARDEAEPLGTFTFVAGGDIALTGGADARVFDGIRRYLRDGDLVVGNLEGTLAHGRRAQVHQRPKRAATRFAPLPAWAGVLRRTGFNVLNVANNHALDYGVEGQRETLAAVRDAGILGPSLPGQVAEDLAAQHPHRADRLRAVRLGAEHARHPPAPLASSAKTARRANVVIVYMHAGAEGIRCRSRRAGDGVSRRAARGTSREFARTMIRAGADLVFGSGPHVVRGIEWYRRRPDRLQPRESRGHAHAQHIRARSGQAPFLRDELDARGRFLAASVVPLRLGRWGHRVPDTRQHRRHAHPGAFAPATSVR